MSERTEKEFAKIENFFCELLTAYRWIPILYVLTCDEIDPYLKRLAWKALSGRLKMLDNPAAENIIREAINRNENWIKYSLADMCYYATKLFGTSDVSLIEGIRMKTYPGRMSEQEKHLCWNYDAFKLWDRTDEEFRILDVGCGTFPYLDKFAQTNAGKVKQYIGIDKSDMAMFSGAHKTDKLGFDVIFHKVNICGNSHKLEEIIETPNVLFFGESFHCLCNPLNIVQRLLDRFPEVYKIAILEHQSDEQQGLFMGFNFHMRMHGGTCVVNEEYISSVAAVLGWRMFVRDASSQHKMFVLVK